MSEPEARGLIGTTVAGCHLEQFLGAGAMGEVYQAQRIADARTVVVKFQSQPGGPQLLERFRREGASLLRLRPHPCVVQVLDLSLTPRPCLVLEFVPGQTLLRLVQERGALPALEAIRIARDIARGMHAVHAQGLLHRDLKPENVLLTPSGQVKIVDFGLVKDDLLTALTEPGQLLGTGPYIAPERWTNEAPDSPRGDVFSLGATLYELVAGRPAFEGRSLEELGEAIEEGDYAPLRERAPEASEDLELVIDQLLAADPDRRVATMQECVDELERLLNGQPCRAPCLARPGGERLLALTRGRFFVIGTDPACSLRATAPGLAAQHAQLRRVGAGLELRDLGTPSGTRVGGVPIGAPVLLRDGDRLQLGALELELRDPRARRDPAATPSDVVRRTLPLPLLEALVRLRHPSSALHLLDRLAPGVWDARALSRLLDPAGATELGLRVRRGAEARRRALEEQLQRVTRQAPQGLEGWLTWWDRVRPQAPPQAVLPQRGGWALTITAGLPATELALGDEGVLLVGRDPKCHLRLDDRSVSRLHATLVRLNDRWFVRDEGRASGTLLNGRRVTRALLGDGDELTIGDVRLALTASRAGPSSSADAISPECFAVLAEQGHPAVTRALIDDLERALRPGQLLALATESGVGDAHLLGPSVQSVLQERARRAQVLLQKIFARNHGPDPAAWRALDPGCPQVRSWGEAVL